MIARKLLLLPFFLLLATPVLAESADLQLVATEVPVAARAGDSVAGRWSATAMAGSISVPIALISPPPPVTSFKVTGPSVVQSGDLFTITVSARTADHNAVATAYAGTISFGSNSDGTLPSDYTFVAASDQGTHRFTVSLHSPGPQSISVTDGHAGGGINLTVLCPPALPSTAIVTAPSGVCANSAGNTASVTASASDYLWAVTNATITAGQGTPKITFTAGASGTAGITVGLSNAFGCAVGVGSASIPIRTAPTAAINAGGTIQACAGAIVGIPVTLTGTAPFTIVWSDGLTQSGITTNTFSRSVPATIARTYSIVSVNDAGCGTGSSGAGVSVVVNTAPVITQQPASVSQHGGERADLSVVATGTNLSYEWYEGEVGDQSHLVGTGPTLTSLPLGRSTRFWVRIFNGCGTVQSNAAVITIRTGRPRTAGH
jgi:hypothetical protein